MSTYSELLKDPRWQKKRLEIFNRDNWTCQHCQSKERTLNVHHMKYSGLPWEADDVSLITFCGGCHELETELCSANPTMRSIAEYSGVPALFQLEILRRSIHMDGINAAREAIQKYDDRYPNGERIYYIDHEAVQNG